MSYKPVIGGFVQIPASGGGAQTLAQTLALGNDANALKIVNLADPTNNQDAVTKNYINSLAVPSLAAVLSSGNDAGGLPIANLPDPSGASQPVTLNYWTNNAVPSATNATNDGSGNNIAGTYATISNVSFTNILTNSGITPIADGTYTVGLGVTTNGTITTVKGLITAIQEAS